MTLDDRETGGEKCCCETAMNPPAQQVSDSVYVLRFGVRDLWWVVFFVFMIVLSVAIDIPGAYKGISVAINGAVGLLGVLENRYRAIIVGRDRLAVRHLVRKNIQVAYRDIERVEIGPGVKGVLITMVNGEHLPFRLFGALESRKTCAERLSLSLKAFRESGALAVAEPSAAR